jgi:hypothetical protein
MTVWIYINTAKEVGDVDRLKVFVSKEALRNAGQNTAHDVIMETG